MTNINEGSIVEVATPTGLAIAIVSKIANDKFDGFLVRRDDFTDVYQEIDAYKDEVISELEPRAAVQIFELGDGYRVSLVILKEEHEYRVRLGSQPRAHSARTMRDVVRIAVREMRSEGLEKFAAHIEHAPGIEEMLHSILGE